MANCKASLNLNHFCININNQLDVYNSLYSLLEIDSDLVDNDEYFLENTMPVVYENEAERIVKEILRENKVASIEDYKKVARLVSEKISEQEYFGLCEISFFAIDHQTISVAFATGGDYGN